MPGRAHQMIQAPDLGIGVRRLAHEDQLGRDAGIFGPQLGDNRDRGVARAPRGEEDLILGRVALSKEAAEVLFEPEVGPRQRF